MTYRNDLPEGQWGLRALRALAATAALVMSSTLLLAGTSARAAVATDRAPAGQAAARVAAAPSVAELEAQVVAGINRLRAKAGCRPLRTNTVLSLAARRHTVLMAKRAELSHRLPGEADLGPRITRAGYRNWSRLAENIALGYTTAPSVVRAWWNSPGHRRNIKNCRLRESGVAVVNANGRYYWTQDFGTRSG